MLVCFMVWLSSAQGIRPYAPRPSRLFANQLLQAIENLFSAPFVFNHLRTLLQERIRQLLCNHILPHSLQKTRGVGTRVCVATVVSWRIVVSSMVSLLVQRSSGLPRFGFALRRTLPGWTEPPHPRQVQRRRCPSKLHGHFSQPAHPESPHSTLLFQDSYDRLGQCFSSPIQGLPGRGTQLASHAQLRRMMRRLLQISAAMQDTSHVAIRHIGINPAFFHHFQVVQREKAAV